MSTTLSEKTRVADPSSPRGQDNKAANRKRAGGWGAIPTLVLIAGAIYTLIPVVWIYMAASKTRAELFTTFTLAPGTGLWDNLTELFRYQDGQYLTWIANSALYSIVGAALSTIVSAMAGYGLAKFSFAGKNTVFYAFFAGILIPGIVIAIPQYLLMAELGLSGSRWSVLLPSIISPFGIYLSWVFAGSAVPTQLLEAARVDGAGEMRIFTRVVLPLLTPGMVTVFLLQFVGTWNNFLLPFIMLTDQGKYPLTVGLYTLLSKGSSQPVLYGVAITGAAVSIIPLVLMVMFLQRYWRLDLISGGLKG